MRNFDFYIGSIVLLTVILTVLIVGKSFGEDNSTTYETMNPKSLAYINKELVCEDLESAMNFSHDVLGQKPLFKWEDITNDTTFMMMFNTKSGEFTVFSKPSNIDTNIICWESQGDNMHVYIDVFKEFVGKYQSYIFGTGT